MLLLTLFLPNYVERQADYLATALYGGDLFIVKSTSFQDLPRFESEQNLECSSNCNASRHNINSINSKLKSNSEEWYKSLSKVPR